MRTDADSGHPPTQFPERGDSQPARPFDTYLRVRHGQTARLSTSLARSGKQLALSPSPPPPTQAPSFLSRARPPRAAPRCAKRRPCNAMQCRKTSSKPLFNLSSSVSCLSLCSFFSRRDFSFPVFFAVIESIGGGNKLKQQVSINQFIHPLPFSQWPGFFPGFAAPPLIASAAQMRVMMADCTARHATRAN